MFKRILPFILAGITALLILAVLSPALISAKKVRVVVAARDLPAGRTLEAGDLEVRELPQDVAPPDALTDPGQAIGRVLAVARSGGEVIRPTHLALHRGLTVDEGHRAIAIHVSLSQGLAGALVPGQQVGVVAVLYEDNEFGMQAPYAKIVLSGLRVLYIPSSFTAPEPTPEPEEGEGGLPQSNLAPVAQQAREGDVVLLVPVDPQDVVYHFESCPEGALCVDRVEPVNALELLAALDADTRATLHLFLEPEGVTTTASSGLRLPSLIVTQPVTISISLEGGLPTPAPALTETQPVTP